MVLLILSEVSLLLEDSTGNVAVLFKCETRENGCDMYEDFEDFEDGALKLLMQGDKVIF